MIKLETPIGFPDNFIQTMKSRGYYVCPIVENRFAKVVKNNKVTYISRPPININDLIVYDNHKQQLLSINDFMVKLNIYLYDHLSFATDFNMKYLIFDGTGWRLVEANSLYTYYKQQLLDRNKSWNINIFPK